MNHHPDDTDRLIDADELRELIPLSKMQFWRMEKAGRFPRRIKIGQRRVAWRLIEIRQWIADRAAERSGEP